MSLSQWQSVNATHMTLAGNLDRETVPAIWQQIQAWQPEQNQVNVSLQQVKRVDSAGMVMLIHLIEHAKNENCHIMLDFVPAKLRTLFQLSNVEEMMTQHITQ